MPIAAWTAWLVRSKKVSGKVLLATILTLAAVTVVGDNFIVASGIVAYDETKILGLRVIRAPIEDFFYAVIAVLLVATLWRQKGSSNQSDPQEKN
jgi:lycopene cyclase domain-containing protein